VPAGQLVGVPIGAVHHMRSLWGEDAWEFKPQRWLHNGAGIPAAVREFQGHRNLVTFASGPRR
jgi:cytochrome P450